MHSKTLIASATLAAAFLLAGCASLPSPEELDRQAVAMVKAGFRDQGIAKTERLNQDLGQAACSSATPPTEAVAARIQAEALATVKWPEGGRYIGDWRAGERLAQNGRGMTWTDASAAPGANGGQCYNCHQIDKKEISYGNIGPSLWNYGKTRGVKDVTDPHSAGIIQYTWTKLWNSKSYAACSNMPRFGHAQLLTEDQLRDVMALILDPKSPVNQ
jgi:L-cysteine S-thiosulfotransferase